MDKKPRLVTELALPVIRVSLLLYLAVTGNEAARERILFVVDALDVVAAQVEKRLEASEEKRQEKR